MYDNPYGIDLGQSNLALQKLGQPTIQTPSLPVMPQTQLTPPGPLSPPEAELPSIADPSMQLKQPEPAPLVAPPAQQPQKKKSGLDLGKIASLVAAFYTGGASAAVMGGASMMASNNKSQETQQKQGLVQGILGGLLGGGK